MHVFEDEQVPRGWSGDDGVERPPSMWDRHVLPTWLPAALGVVLGVVAALLIVGGEWVFVAPLVLAIPALIVFLRYPFAAVLVWIMVFPFFTQTPTASYRYMYWLLHRAMIPAALGLLLLSTWLRIRKQERIRWGRAELVMVLFLALLVTNILISSPSPSQSLIHLYDRLVIPFCMYWFVRLVAPTARDITRLAWAALVALVPQVMIGLIGWFAPHALPDQWLGRAGERTVGTLDNPAVYTSTLIFLALLVLQYAMQGNTRRLRAVLLGMFGLAFVCIFFSFSRGSWLGALFVWVGLLFVYPLMMRRITMAAVLIGLVAGSTVFATQLRYATQRLQDDATAESRILQNAGALRMINQKMWFGWGFGTYDVYDEQFLERVGDVPVRRREQTSHNTFLLITAETGVVGLVLYLFPVGWWLTRSRNVWQRLPRSGIQSWHLVAMLWLLLLDHFTVNNFMAMLDAYPFGTTIWWLALGLIASQVYPHLQPHDLQAPSWIQRTLAEPVP